MSTTSKKPTATDDMPHGVPRDIDDDASSPAKPAPKRPVADGSKTDVRRRSTQEAAPSQSRPRREETPQKKETPQKAVPKPDTEETTQKRETAQKAAPKPDTEETPQKKEISQKTASKPEPEDIHDLSEPNGLDAISKPEGDGQISESEEPMTTTRRDKARPELSDEEKAQAIKAWQDAKAMGLNLGQMNAEPTRWPLKSDVFQAKTALDVFSLDLYRILLGLLEKSTAPQLIDIMQQNQRVRDYNAALRDRRYTGLLPLITEKGELHELLYKREKMPSKAGNKHTMDTIESLSPDEKKSVLFTIRELENLTPDIKQKILNDLKMTGALRFESLDEDREYKAEAATMQLRIAMGLPAVYSASG
ncbi:hypothetical protein PFICI_05015 [Pestalotiopsis fici W106-1]|uniref:Uncharacterized protein n=1 Tax=Pestalotiopsis fici (strain W106-1 / CGMCC3.15140) TaxID=1229662 RepID=W3XAS4_PESFW|nr:uncharacterized protein PFICI_05015 [Pestalotiopsis fici W106-1]ETS83139.1 hypothetical protein PFICI_05015 [Pestalotiopsis fici W106-1]